MVDNNIRVSIIIPCFNDGKYILEAIESVEKYKGNDAEIIIINDGSTDPQTLSNLKNLESKDYYIINQEKHGLATTSNNAIKKAKGQYILPLQADNKIKSEYISKSLKILDANPSIGVVYGDVEFIGEERGIITVSDFDMPKLLLENYIDTCAIFRKKVWEDVGGYDTKLDKLFGVNWEFWISTSKAGWSFFHLSEVSFYCRKKKDIITLKSLNSSAHKEFLNYIIFQKHADFLLSQFESIYQELSTYDAENIAKTLYEKDTIIKDLQSQIINVQRSITWKIINKINKFTDLLFPQSSKRRRIFDLGMMGVTTIINDGWKTFRDRVKKYKNYDIRSTKKEYYFITNEIKSQHSIDQINDEIEQFKYKPIISLIMPIRNTPPEVFEKTIASVQNQIYPNWELCISYRNSNTTTKKMLEEYIQSGSRIKLIFLDGNDDISVNSNLTISLTTGEFIGFLDNNDELTFDALFEIVRLLQEHPDADLIYSDEDKIDDKGKRSDFFFKPDWSPDLLLSQNYISHLSVFRKEIVDRIGGFRPGFTGVQDYDLLLRFTECTKNIFHIPKILYHGRISQNMKMEEPDEKESFDSNAKKALTDAMQRRNISIGNIENGKYYGCYRIKYNLYDNEKVSIIIPTKDNLLLLKRCIQSILMKTEYTNYEILIINNQSEKDETLQYFKTINNDIISIIDYDETFNFSALNNYAVGYAKGKYLLFLNNDIEIISNGWIVSMLEYCQKSTVGAVGAKLLYPDDTIQHAGVILFSKKLINHSHKYMPDNHPGYFLRPHVIQNICAVTGACLMIKREHFKEVGGFDEKNLTIMFNDVDLCLALLSRGYSNIYTPYARLYHYESVSRGFEMTPKLQNEINFVLKKWKYLIGNDPFYNPNLSRTKEDFSLR